MTVLLSLHWATQQRAIPTSLVNFRPPTLYIPVTGGSSLFQTYKWCFPMARTGGQRSGTVRSCPAKCRATTRDCPLPSWSRGMAGRRGGGFLTWGLIRDGWRWLDGRRVMAWLLTNDLDQDSNIIIILPVTVFNLVTTSEGKSNRQISVYYYHIDSFTFIFKSFVSSTST